MTRRDATWAIFKAAGVAGGSEFFRAWMQAAQPASHSVHAAAPPDAHDWSTYKPKFFSEKDFANLQSFAEILIPSDETPGAREAFVAPFVDFVVDAAAEYAPEMQDQWRSAMKWLDEQSFAEMPAEHRVAFMEQISVAERERSKPRDKGFETYKLIKEMTVHAYYTSRVGLVEELQYKGLAYLTEFPGCSHAEHSSV